MTEDEGTGWYHRLNGHEVGQTSGGGEGQGDLACCSTCDCKELDRTEQLNNNKVQFLYPQVYQAGMVGFSLKGGMLLMMTTCVHRNLLVKVCSFWFGCC